MKFFTNILLCISLLMPAASFAYTKQQDRILFQFDNEDLVDIVHRLAAKKEVNIIFPVKAPINARITMYLEDPLTLDQAWEKLYTLLDLAGYALIEKESQWTIVKVDNNITRETLPLYIAVPPDKIPNSDERIRYIYYLTNLKIGNSAQDFNNTDISKILADMLPEKSFFPDPISNGLIMMDKANNIKAVMDIVTQLDGTTLRETFTVMQLHNTNPTEIKELFDKLSKTEEKYKFDTKKQVTDATYFPKNVRLFAVPRTNSLIILGSQAAIERVRDFIVKYIDVELESGKSILHIYKLQYMDANAIAEVLKKVLKTDSRSGQSTPDVTKSPINPTTQVRVFDKIIIATDVPPAGTTSGPNDTPVYFGNNNLIIACRNDDWVRIKSLIEQLDQVQPQVIIEVLIANLTLNDVKSLGAIAANPNELNFPPGVNIQSAQIGPNVVVNPVQGTSPNQTATLASSLAGDLMGNLPNDPLGITPPNPVPVYLTPGATVLALDNGTAGENGFIPSTWAILQMLDLFSYTKVIANPHLIATHNTKAYVKIGQTRLINDQTVGSGGGTTVVKLKDIGAIYELTIIPRIYTSDTPGGKDDAVNLDVLVSISDFIPGNASNARLSRDVKTQAVLKNGQILALGGLIDHEIDDSWNGSPILSRIPILGWLTKFRSTTRADTNLTIFIAPTIIEPRLRGGLSQYTKDYVNITKKYSNEAELFDSLQDPVTRFFFKRVHDSQGEIDEFVNQDEFKREVNTNKYKTIIDVDAAKVKEAQAQKPQDTNKKTKRIVLTNVDKDKNVETKHHATEPALNPAATTTKVCAANPDKENADPLTTNVKPQQEDIALAKVDVKKMDRNMLRDRLQKILEAEDNPLL
jgi:general secretion pathway protein D